MDRVEYGYRHDIDGVHESELVIIHFTDGSIMSLDAATNTVNVLRDASVNVRPDDFHVSVSVQWGPPKGP